MDAHCGNEITSVTRTSALALSRRHIEHLRPVNISFSGKLLKRPYDWRYPTPRIRTMPKRSETSGILERLRVSKCIGGRSLEANGSVQSLFQEMVGKHEKNIENEQWWLWGLVVVLTMALTAGLACFALLHVVRDSWYEAYIRQSVRGLVGLVLLFDLYSLYQQRQLYLVRRQLVGRDKLFRIITENAVDMIALVTGAGERIYISPSYCRVLGYSIEELLATG